MRALQLSSLCLAALRWLGVSPDSMTLAIAARAMSMVFLLIFSAWGTVISAMKISKCCDGSSSTCSWSSSVSSVGLGTSSESSSESSGDTSSTASLNTPSSSSSESSVLDVGRHNSRVDGLVHYSDCDTTSTYSKVRRIRPMNSFIHVYFMGCKV